METCYNLFPKPMSFKGISVFKGVVQVKDFLDRPRNHKLFHKLNLGRFNMKTDKRV